MGAINPKMVKSDSKEQNFIPGPNCNCPSDCEETIYSQEMSQANMKYKNRFMEKLHRPGKLLNKLQTQIDNLAGNKRAGKKKGIFSINLILFDNLKVLFFRKTAKILLEYCQYQFNCTFLLQRIGNCSIPKRTVVWNHGCDW